MNIEAISPERCLFPSQASAGNQSLHKTDSFVRKPHIVTSEKCPLFLAMTFWCHGNTWHASDCRQKCMWVWLKNRYTKWNPGKWNKKLQPAVPGGLTLTTHTHGDLAKGLAPVEALLQEEAHMVIGVAWQKLGDCRPCCGFRPGVNKTLKVAPCPRPSSSQNDFKGAQRSQVLAAQLLAILGFCFAFLWASGGTRRCSQASASVSIRSCDLGAGGFQRQSRAIHLTKLTKPPFSLNFRLSQLKV